MQIRFKKSPWRSLNSELIVISTRIVTLENYFKREYDLDSRSSRPGINLNDRVYQLLESGPEIQGLISNEDLDL
jgi:hypothetical protein